MTNGKFRNDKEMVSPKTDPEGEARRNLDEDSVEASVPNKTRFDLELEWKHA